MSVFKKCLSGLGALALSLCGFVGTVGVANAAVANCGAIQVEDVAVCESFGQITSNAFPVFQTSGVATTVDGSAGNNTVISFDGLATSLNCTKPFNAGGSGVIQTVAVPSNCSPAIDAALNYLLFISETGQTPRDWVVVSVSGADYLAGLDYVEGPSFTGAAKVDVMLDPRTGGCTVNCNPNPVPVPGSMALLGLGLGAFGWVNRKRA